MKVYKKIMNGVAFVEKLILVLSTILIVVLTVGNVLSRKILHQSWSFTEELVVAVFVLITLLAAALAVDDIRSRIFHVILLDELVADNIALIFYGNAAHRYRTVLIAVYDALLKDHTRYNADDHKNHRDAEAQTPQKLPFFFDFKPGNSNQLPTLCERTSVHLDFSRSFRADGGYVHLRCAHRPGTHSPRQCSAGSLCCTPCSD